MAVVVLVLGVALAALVFDLQLEILRSQFFFVFCDLSFPGMTFTIATMPLFLFAAFKKADGKRVRVLVIEQPRVSIETWHVST